MIIKQYKFGKWETVCDSTIVRVVSKSGKTTYYLRDNLTFFNKVDLIETTLEKENIDNLCIDDLSDTERELGRINSKLVNVYKDRYENLLETLNDFIISLKETEISTNNDAWGECADELTDIINKSGG